MGGIIAVVVDRAGLLRLEVETLWVTDERGRIVRSRAEDVPFEPLLVVAGHPDGCVWAASVAVPTDLDAAIAGALASTGPALAVRWAPDAATELLRLLAGVPDLGPLASPMGGPSWVIPPIAEPLRPEVELRTSLDGDADDVRALLPADERGLSEPWVVALVDGRVAAVCETARSAPASVEAGVWTHEPHRRRGLAVAVTAAWRDLVSDRTAFYSTSWDNVASRGVARRLGLQPLGQWWQVYRRE